MSFTEIDYRVEQHVAVVTLNRPQSLNAWTPVMSREVRRAMHAASGDSEVRVIVLTGAGRGFCAGVDMKLPAGDADPSGDDPAALFGGTSRKDFLRRNTYFPAVPKPIIAAINGPCAGIGLTFALFCDLRFAAEEASFTTAFARRGLVAEHGISWTLPRLVGHSTAADLLLSARKFMAPEAFRLGMVDRLYPLTELMPATLAYARELSELSSPRSLNIIKRQLWLSHMQTLDEAMDVADYETALSLKSEDYKEGIRHFLEKRAPAFTGR